MKKIYIGLLIVNSFIGFNAQARTNYLDIHDEFETIENFTKLSTVGRDASIAENIGDEAFSKAHYTLFKNDAISDDYHILNELDSISKSLHNEFLTSDRPVRSNDIGDFYKFDSIHAKEREAPITADDIMKINGESYLKNKNSKTTNKSLFGNFFGSRSTDKKQLVENGATLSTNNYVKIANNETQNGITSKDIVRIGKGNMLNSSYLTYDTIDFANTYNQKELLKELNKKGLFNKST